MLFVTSADRPFTESERQFLEAVREWGKKILVVINKVDLFETPGAARGSAELRGRPGAPAAGDGARDLPGQRPARAARESRRARRCGPPSGFDRLETYIRERLDEHERVRLKLANPLGVGSRWLAGTWRW